MNSQSLLLKRQNEELLKALERVVAAFGDLALRGTSPDYANWSRYENGNGTAVGPELDRSLKHARRTIKNLTPQSTEAVKYIVLSLKHSTPNQPCFWKANNAGYTYFPFNAGIYTEDQIREQPHYYNDGVTAIAIPLTDAAMETIGFRCSVDYEAARKFATPQTSTR